LEIVLTANEARVLGALIEKERITPDNYPLSLGALVSACNQRSSRDPVMTLDETETLEALDSLTGKHLAREKTPAGSRVTKYAHRLSNTLGLTHDLAPRDLAVLCVLLLRGAQTVGEIRARTGRLCDFTSLTQVEESLARLTDDEHGPYVTQLPRQRGRKERRYAHLLCGPVFAEVEPARAPDAPAPRENGATDDRIVALEEQVSTLRSELEEIKKLLAE